MHKTVKMLIFLSILPQGPWKVTFLGLALLQPHYCTHDHSHIVADSSTNQASQTEARNPAI